jgi:predicted PurR-regulated permease PerM
MSFIYNGEEIGMVNGHVPQEMVQDPAASGGAGRDPERTPMQWTSGKNAGFSNAKTTWLPVANGYEQRNVESENNEQGSFLTLYKSLTKLRNKSEALRYGEIKLIKTGSGKVLCFKRSKGKQSHIILINFSIDLVEVKLPPSVKIGEFQISSDAETLHKDTKGNKVHLLPNEAAVFAAKTPVNFRLSQEWIQTTVITLAQKVGTAFLHNLAVYAGSFFSFFTTAIIFIFVFLSLLKNQHTLTETFRSLNPLGEDISNLYLSRVSAMTKAMVRGQFIIAIAQGFSDAVLIYLGGLHGGFFFLLMLLSILSFIPLGGGILAIPIGIAMALTGNWVGGLIVILGHLLIVTNIDNILRPRLVPAEAKLDSALMILSVFSGIALLGFLGIIVGPVITIIIVTTISVYKEVYKNVEMERVPAAGGNSHKRSLWQRFRRT